MTNCPLAELAQTDGSNTMKFTFPVVDEALARAAEKTRFGELKAASQLIDEAIAQHEQASHEQAKTMRERYKTLLETGIRQDYLRFDVEALVAKLLKLKALLNASSPAAFDAVIEWLGFHERGSCFGRLVARGLAQRPLEGAHP
jgi:hypothetical protein